MTPPQLLGDSEKGGKILGPFLHFPIGVPSPHPPHPNIGIKNQYFNVCFIVQTDVPNF